MRNLQATVTIIDTKTGVRLVSISARSLNGIPYKEIEIYDCDPKLAPRGTLRHTFTSGLKEGCEQAAKIGKEFGSSLEGWQIMEMLEAIFV